jgi:hypothetical protein
MAMMIVEIRNESDAAVNGVGRLPNSPIDRALFPASKPAMTGPTTAGHAGGESNHPLISFPALLFDASREF